jgi:hypothetical protein
MRMVLPVICMLYVPFFGCALDERPCRYGGVREVTEQADFVPAASAQLRVSDGADSFAVFEPSVERSRRRRIAQRLEHESDLFWQRASHR